MPSIFKTLASISVWILFIMGAGSMVVISIDFVFSPEEVYHFNDVTWATLTVLSLFLGMLAIKIRKSLD
jgi:hypothetical protein